MIGKDYFDLKIYHQRGVFLMQWMRCLAKLFREGGIILIFESSDIQKNYVSAISVLIS